MKIRAVTVADAAALARIHATAFDAPWDTATLAAMLATPQVVAFVADLASARAGFILCRTAADEAEILTLATGRDQRRRGVASALLDAAMEAARTRGAGSLFLEVAADNIAALALYEKAGFRAVGTRRDYYIRAGGAADAAILRRDLNI